VTLDKVLLRKIARYFSRDKGSEAQDESIDRKSRPKVRDSPQILWGLILLLYGRSLDSQNRDQSSGYRRTVVGFDIPQHRFLRVCGRCPLVARMLALALVMPSTFRSLLLLRLSRD
jgi:hypothetical protein